MGKGTDLWDDSALLRAFDNAITKFQRMHEKTDGSYNIPNKEDDEEDEVTKSDDGIEPALTQTETANSAMDACQSSYNTEESNGFQSIQNHQIDESFHASEPCMHSVNPDAEKVFESHELMQGADYNQLLSQYYKLEEQRQALLHQLQQVGCWDYRIPTEASGYIPSGSHCCATSPLLKDNASQPGQFSCYSACCGHCLVTPCHSMPTCAVGGPYSCENGTCSFANKCGVNPVKMSLPADNCMFNFASKAAEAELQAMNLGTSVGPNAGKGEDTKEGGLVGALHFDGSRDVNTKTDLTAVLNAWYSAGFYTGKYLSEQSLTKKQC